MIVLYIYLIKLDHFYTKMDSEETADLIGKDYLLQHIKFNNGDTIIDCGKCWRSLFFKKKSININYIGFEPSPMEFKCLERNISGVI